MTQHYQHTQHDTQATNTPWQPQANCRNQPTNHWYPEQSDNHKARHAKQICTTCPVKTQCLQWALDNDERHGIWGGLTDRERRTLQRRQRRERQLAREAASS